MDASYENGRLVLEAKEIQTPQKTALDATQDRALEEAPSTEQLDLNNLQEENLMPEAQYIEDIQMYRSGNSTVVSIIGDGKMRPDILPANNKLIIDIKNVAMKARVPNEVARPLKGIRWGEYEDKTRIVLDLEPDTTFDVVSIGDRVEVNLRSSKAATPNTGMVKEKVLFKDSAASTLDQVVEPDQAVKTKYTGKRISLDFQDADIIPIFRLLADVSGYNIVVDPTVKGKITMKLINVPWDQALDLILKTHNLDKVVEGNIIRIAPTSVIAKEKEAKARIEAAKRKAEPLVTKVFPISYADVNSVRSAIERAKILSERGSISVDERISSLIVKDVESNMPKVEELIKTLDKQTTQVLIEARIVEVNTNAARDLGIQWGGFVNFRQNGQTMGGVSGYSTLSSLGAWHSTTAADDFTNSESFTVSNPAIVDFPAAISAGSGSGIAFGFLSAAGTFGLDLRLSALKTMGKLKIVSNPRIITVDNEEAVISQGKSIPVRKLTSEGTVATEFKDIKLELKVKPHITPDNSIVLSVEAMKEELDPTIPSVEGVPGTDKKEAKTNVIIKNGETLVIGGIYKTITNNTESGVPGLANIPVLGWLFKKEQKESQTNELLIFITPRIIKKQ
ncbi:MAG: type IV pilus secretin PilQ [Nitrospirae bacterium]|nr:type IV pilus secretin PilQ [Nitrospirota bacterium]